jgi:hypothetical protein
MWCTHGQATVERQHYGSGALFVNCPVATSLIMIGGGHVCGGCRKLARPYMLRLIIFILLMVPSVGLSL